MRPHKVKIDGVIYVPVIDASPDMEAIQAGIISSFWGDTPERGAELAERSEGLTVCVYDDDDYREGTPLDEVLADIAKELARK